MGCAARLSPRSVCCRAGVGGGKRCFDVAPVCAEPNPQAEELTRSPGGARGCAHTDACASSPTPGPDAVTLPFTQPGSSQPITPPPSSRHRHTQTPPPVHSAQDSASEPLQSVPPAGPASPPPLSPPQPPSLCCNLWKLVSDASSRHSIFIYLFSCRRDPPGGRAAAGTGQARRCRDSEAEDGGKRTPEPSARSSGPASRQGP